jgi:hypothetical protein
MMLEEIALSSIWWRTNTLACESLSPIVHAREIKPSDILA